MAGDKAAAPPPLKRWPEEVAPQGVRARSLALRAHVARQQRTRLFACAGSALAPLGAAASRTHATPRVALRRAGAPAVALGAHISAAARTVTLFLCAHTRSLSRALFRTRLRCRR
jgi:hypothetical protein